MVLLAGPVASYMAGQFVGHADIPTVAAGEQFDVGFGIDSSFAPAGNAWTKARRCRAATSC